MGLIQAFSMPLAFQRIDAFAKRKLESVVAVLASVGEQIVDEARMNGTYQDRTGNLRGSIAYVIVFNGDIVDRNFKGTAEGQADAWKLIRDLIAEHGDREAIILIVVAGMNYGLAVESKGYDVISGSTRGKNEMIETLRKEIGLT